MYKIYIMTFDKASEKRRKNAEKLAKETNGSIFVGTVNANQNFLEIFKLCSKENCDLLFIEDDVKLCSNFIQEIEKAIYQLPNQIIHFYHDDETHRGFIRKLPGKYFHSTQCVYFPLLYINQYINSYNLICLKNKPYFEKKEYDLLFCKMLEEMNCDFWSWYPRLVKILNYKTELNHTRYVYNTTCFKDDL